MARFTIFGGKGFIGNAVARELRAAGHEAIVPGRGDMSVPAGGFGRIIWCIGLTADFRSRPIETLDAHCSLMTNVLRHCAHDGFVYLSSTRVYARSTDTIEEGDVRLRIGEMDDLYNATKLTGEFVTLAAGGPYAKVVRLSNVVGPAEGGRQTFLGAIIREARAGSLYLQSAPSTRKDYIWIDDAARLLIAIAERGRANVYNLASGTSINHQAWVDALAQKLHFETVISKSAPDLSFPDINIDRLSSEFDAAFSNPLSRIGEIIGQ